MHKPGLGFAAESSFWAEVSSLLWLQGYVCKALEVDSGWLLLDVCRIFCYARKMVSQKTPNPMQNENLINA
jgi:hypothetical protein